ncbi:hypothetical protein [Massilia niabensis]|uniref:Uncharacterized protein n=1 Tax=Massilia niabensis TaxID=544910 RepID=A0ABW0L2Y4_9BURK
MSFASTLVQFSFPMLSLAETVRAAFMLFLLASLLMFFRPLLQGVVRALALVLRAGLSRKAAAAGPTGIDA